MKLGRSSLRWNDAMEDKFWWVFTHLLIPVLALFALITGAGDVGHAYDAAHGKGTPGTFTAESVECQQGTYSGYRCTGYYGRFTSDDGRIRLTHVFFDRGLGIARDLPHDPRFRVRYVGGRPPPVVYDANGSKEWILIAGIMTAAAITLIVWAMWLIGSSRRRKGFHQPGFG